MKNPAFLFLFLCATLSLQAQPSNRRTSEKKQGPSLVYLDAAWFKVKDSTKAVYCRYTYFEKGENIYPMGPRDRKWTLKHNGEETRMPCGARLLNGEYVWVDGKGRTRSIDHFDSGNYVKYQWFYKSGQINQVFNYREHWREQEHTYQVKLYSKTGHEKIYYMRMGPNGWLFYPQLVSSQKTDSDS